MQNKKAKRLALISEDLPEIIVKYLENSGCGCVRLPKYKNLAPPVASHPDMLFSIIGEGLLLTDGGYLEDNPFLYELPLDFKISKTKLGREYPLDIAFDALVFGGCVYGKLDYIAPEIRQKAKREVNVAQGYTLCSTLITESCAISADFGICRALAKDGISVLKILPDGIELDEYCYGFIGGASLYDTENNTVIFFGDLTAHPDCKIITEFLEKHGHRIKYFGGLPLTDYGGAKLIRI